MTEDKEGLLRHNRQTRDELLSAIEGLNDALLAEPSLDGWSVKDHLAHIAGWDDIRASEVVRISAGYESAWRMTNEQDAAYNALAYDLRLNLSLDQVRWELETSRQRLLTAISSEQPVASTIHCTARRVYAPCTKLCIRSGSRAGGRRRAFSPLAPEPLDQRGAQA